VLRTAAGRTAVGLGEEERFVSLIHLGQPIQEKEPPERAPLADTVKHLD
jgi:hypothetical protein